MGTLEDIADLAERFEVKSPSTIVVGGVVGVLLGEDYSGEYNRMVKKEGMGRGGEGTTTILCGIMKNATVGLEIL